MAVINSGHRQISQRKVYEISKNAENKWNSQGNQKPD
jgi:hypothetical protein